MTGCVGEYDCLDVSTGVQNVMPASDRINTELTDKLNEGCTSPGGEYECDYCSSYSDSIFWVGYRGEVTENGVLRFVLDGDETPPANMYRLEKDEIPVHKYCIDLDVISERIGLECVRVIELPYYTPDGRPVHTEVTFEAEKYSVCKKAYDKVVWDTVRPLTVNFSDSMNGIGSDELFLNLWGPSNHRNRSEVYMTVEYGTGNVYLNTKTEQGPMSKRTYKFDGRVWPMFRVNGDEFPSRLRKKGAIKKLTLDIGGLGFTDKVNPTVYMSLEKCRDYIENRYGAVHIEGGIHSQRLVLDVCGKRKCMFAYCDSPDFDTANITDGIKVSGTSDLDWTAKEYKDGVWKLGLDKPMFGEDHFKNFLLDKLF